MVEKKFKFKSTAKYYYDEREGLKNNTVRKIDLSDKRFMELIYWAAHEGEFAELGLEIEIKLVDEYASIGEKFARPIQHIAVWKDLMIITWEHLGGKE